MFKYSINPEVVTENSENQLVLEIKGLDATDATFDVSTGEDYKVVGDFKKNINLQPNETESVTVVFTPLKSGKIELHPYLIDKNDIVLWETSIPIDVKKPTA